MIEETFHILRSLLAASFVEAHLLLSSAFSEYFCYRIFSTFSILSELLSDQFLSGIIYFSEISKVTFKMIRYILFFRSLSSFINSDSLFYKFRFPFLFISIPFTNYVFRCYMCKMFTFYPIVNFFKYTIVFVIDLLSINSEPNTSI